MPLEKHNSPFWWKRHSAGWVLLPWLENLKGNVNCFSGVIVEKRTLGRLAQERWVLVLIRERAISASLWKVSSAQGKFRSGMEIPRWFAFLLLLSGDGRTDWRLRAVLTSVLLCHRLWASSACCLCCFFLLWRVASWNGNAKGRGKKRLLWELISYRSHEGHGKGACLVFSRCRAAVDGSGPSNPMCIQAWGIE